MCKSNLSVIFLPNVFTCCLLHKLLRTKDETSIKHLFCIIELEASSSHEDKHVNIVQDDQPSNQRLDGEERSEFFW
jgi:hypothetical protein